MSGFGKRLLTVASRAKSSGIFEKIALPSLAPYALSPSKFMGGVPEDWGRPSHYTEGTEFLGTPKNHLSLAKNRPLSPHVFDVGFKGMHYDFPLGAISSVTNRVTGAVLWAGVAGIGCVGLVTDIGALVDYVKTTLPLLVYPVKFGVSFCLVYHYLGGIRHFWWDYANYGNQCEKNSPLETEMVYKSAVVCLGAGTVLSLAMTLA